MIVQISSNDNGSGTNTTLTVTKCYNTTQKLFEQRPYCLIDEQDFCELLTNKQIDKMYEGEINFNVSLMLLTEKAKRIF